MSKQTEALKLALEKVQEFKARWWKVPPFGNKVNKATREAITNAHSPIFELENAIRSALAEQPAQQQEPVEWDGRCVLGHCGSPTGCELSDRCRADNTPAQQQEPVAKPKLIGWRTENFLWETNDIKKAQNWEPNIGVLPIFEGDPNTQLTSPASKPLTDEQIDKKFEEYADQFDTDGDEWLDMGVIDYFRAGFKAAHGIKGGA